MTRAELEQLAEYSCSIPTGTSLGKRWRCNRDAYRARVTIGLHPFDGTPVLQPLWPPDWWLGEYVPHPEGDPQKVGIQWRKIEVHE